MRAPLLRLALLLAAAQYAEGSACPGAPAPTLTFPIVDPDVAAEVDCKDFDLDNTAACDSLHKIFMREGDKWTEVNKVECDSAGPKWKATPTDGGANVELATGDIIVCAKRSPDTKKCGLCLPVTDGTCTPDVCEAGDKIAIKNNPTGCPEMTCDVAQMLSLNAHATRLDKTKKVTCNEQKKWTDGGSEEVAVTSALCVKSFVCPKPASLKPDCADAALIKNSTDCEAPDIDNGALKCGTGKKIFVPSGPAAWKEGTVKCDATKGKWMLNGTTPTEITKAVCAIADPTPSKSTVLFWILFGALAISIFLLVISILLLSCTNLFSWSTFTGYIPFVLVVIALAGMVSIFSVGVEFNFEFLGPEKKRLEVAILGGAVTGTIMGFTTCTYGMIVNFAIYVNKRDNPTIDMYKDLEFIQFALELTTAIGTLSAAIFIWGFLFVTGKDWDGPKDMFESIWIVTSTVVSCMTPFATFLKIKITVPETYPPPPRLISSAQDRNDQEQSPLETMTLDVQVPTKIVIMGIMGPCRSTTASPRSRRSSCPPPSRWFVRRASRCSRRSARAARRSRWTRTTTRTG